MNLNELLEYVAKNARDVADLVKVADIRRLEPGDPWRGVLIEELRARYEDEALGAFLEEDFFN